MSKATITIVEDEIIIARELAARLNGLGYDVADIAASKQEAIRRVESRQPDLVFMDIVLRGNGDGIEAAEEIRSRFDIPIVYVTAYADDVTLERAKATAPFGYVLKPFSESLLRATIEMALYKHQIDRQLRAANEQLEERVRDRTRELQAKNRAMQEEFQIARELQLAMLPHYFPSVPRSARPDQSALRFSSFYKAMGPVGGDFFDVLSLSDTSVGVFICDVMGHDVSAALVTAMLRALVEDLGPRTLDPGQLLCLLNHALAGFFHELDRAMFATAFYLVADLARGQGLYSSAGHPSPLRWQRPANAVAALVPAGRQSPALGLLDEAIYVTAQCPLAPGDTFLLLTDGLLETENGNSEWYGKERLAAAVSRHAPLGGPELLKEVLADVRQFAQGTDVTDDVCLVEMEVTRLI
jgi:serine phosphatase RsbU (regulator of sigma subunit)